MSGELPNLANRQVIKGRDRDLVKPTTSIDREESETYSEMMRIHLLLNFSYWDHAPKYWLTQGCAKMLVP